MFSASFTQVWRRQTTEGVCSAAFPRALRCRGLLVLSVLLVWIRHSSTGVTPASHCPESRGFLGAGRFNRASADFLSHIYLGGSEVPAVKQASCEGEKFPQPWLVKTPLAHCVSLCHPS